MKNRRFLIAPVFACLLLGGPWVHAATAPPKETTFETRPLGMKLSIKMVGPYMEAVDLQIICVFKHKPSGDTYLGAAKEFDEKVGGVLSALRNHGEFIGELGETIAFNPPKDSIPAKRVLVIGLGDEAKISLNSLGLAGRVAAREAVRLKARRVAWAPVIRDEGNSVLDVGESDGQFVEQMLLAYDTQKRLQAQGLADEFSLEDWVIEAGPSYFDNVVKRVGEILYSAVQETARRPSAPYVTRK